METPLKNNNYILKILFILICIGLLYVAYLELTYPTELETQHFERHHKKAMGLP